MPGMNSEVRLGDSQPVIPVGFGAQRSLQSVLSTREKSGIRILAALSMLGLAACTADAISLHTPEYKLDELLVSLGTNGPGCAYAIRHDGDLVRQRAVGTKDLTDSARLSADDYFDIGSVSKSFTAAVILELQRSSKLSLGDRVALYVHNLPAWGDRVTVGDLLYMRSGIPEFIVSNPDTVGWSGDTLSGTEVTMSDQASVEKIVGAIRSMDVLEFETALKYAYSNSNYVLLRRVAESATARPFAELIQDMAARADGVDVRISKFEAGRRMPASSVNGHDLSEGNRPVPFLSDWDVLGASSVWVSVSGLSAWGSALLSDHERFSGMSAVGTWREPDDHGIRGYAAGLMTTVLDGEPIVYHLGGSEGFSSGLFLRPDHGQVLAFSCNMSPDLVFATALTSESAQYFARYGELVFLHAWLSEQR